jgi:hypothetical protein
MDGRIMSGKSSELEKYQRLLIVEEMILKGCSKSYIVRFASETWKIGERQTETYLAESYDKIKCDFQVTFEKETFKEEIYGRLQDLYRKNYTIQDFRECRNIVKDLRDILGIDETKKTETHITGEMVVWNEEKTYETN